MNSKMRSFYNISNIDFNDENLVFVPDTNILLSLYLFEDDTFKSLTDSMRKAQSNFWIPYNVALEYQRNRINQIKSGEQVRKQIENCFSKVNKAFEELVLNIESKKSNKYQSLIDEIKELHLENNSRNEGFLNRHHSSLPSPTKNDYFNDKVRVAIDELVGDRVGDAYDKENLDIIYKEGEERYKNSIPPGYKDAQRKEGEVFHYGNICYLNKFGDLVIWKQILDFISNLESGKKVVFVTNDLKDDWWIKLNDIKIPHYSLKQEALIANPNVDFDMLTADEFFKSLASYKTSKSSQAKVISDIDRVIEISLSKDDSESIEKINALHWLEENELSDNDASIRWNQVPGSSKGKWIRWADRSDKSDPNRTSIRDNESDLLENLQMKRWGKSSELANRARNARWNTESISKNDSERNHNIDDELSGLASWRYRNSIKNENEDKINQIHNIRRSRNSISDEEFELLKKLESVEEYNRWLAHQLSVMKRKDDDDNER